MRRLLVALPTVTLLGAASADARTMLYTVHVGVNAPPSGSGLSALRYADDDAARFYRFVLPFARRAHLLTVLDRDSQRRFGALAARTQTPSRVEIDAVLGELKRRIRRDRDGGDRVVLYFTYSGHGVREAEETALTVLDGKLDREWFDTRVLSLPADVIHLFIDACHAEGLVRGRGVVTKVVSARTRRLTPPEREGLFRSRLLERHPNVGALVAAASNQEAHEWSRVRSGLFTHQLLSALAGAADVNGDRRIAYSEAAAFISAANGAIRDSRVAPSLRSLPPRLDRNTPILDRRWIRRAALLEGVPASLGHFHVETEDGDRVLDAHGEQGTRLTLLVPAGRRLWLRTVREEAAFTVAAGQTLPSRALRLAALERRLDSRGSADFELRKNLFATPFGVNYYRGWIHSQGEVSVTFAASRPPAVVRRDRRPRRRGRTGSVLCLVGAAASAATAAVFTGLAVSSMNDYNATDYQKPAREAEDRVALYRGLAIGTAAAAAGLGLAAWLLWPTDHEPSSAGPTVTVGPDSVGASYRLAW